VRQIVLNPLIMSACAGEFAAALHIHPPVAIENTLLFPQNAAATTALFVLGVTVALRPFGRVPWEVPAVIAVKLLVHPLVVFGLMLLLGPFPQPWAATSVLMASLPPALNVFVIARQNDTWIEPASMAVLIGTFASVITLTSVMWLMQTGRHPENRRSSGGAARPKSADKRHRNALFNHLIGTAQQRLGNCKAQRLGRLEIDDHLDFRGPLDWQVGGFLAPENLTSVDAD
jgi:Membrane transport protein